MNYKELKDRIEALGGGLDWRMRIALRIAWFLLKRDSEKVYTVYLRIISDWR